MRKPVEQKNKPTLIINLNHSTCGFCGYECDFFENNHARRLGLGVKDGEVGCGIVWTEVTSGYSDMKGSCLNLRPDLKWVDFTDFLTDLGPAVTPT